MAKRRRSGKKAGARGRGRGSKGSGGYADSRRASRADRSDEEWRDWGMKFGKRMEKRGRDFGEEMAAFGAVLDRRMDHEGKVWCVGPFGAIGPLIGSVIAMVFFAIGIIALQLLNVLLGSVFISALVSFLLTYAGVFFAIFLFNGYCKYLSRRYWREFWIMAPMLAAIGSVIFFWVAAWLIALVNTAPSIGALTAMSAALFANLRTIFAAVLVLGYGVVAVWRIMFELKR